MKPTLFALGCALLALRLPCPGAQDLFQPIGRSLPDWVAAADTPADRALRLDRALDILRQSAQEPVEPLGLADWAIPFMQLHTRAQRDLWRTPAEAESALRADLELLRGLDQRHGDLPARAAARLTAAFADRWLHTDPAACLTMIEEIEAWLAQQPGGMTLWHAATPFTHANLLLLEERFPPAERGALRSGRTARLRAMGADNGLSPRLRTSIVTHWGHVLAARGQPERAVSLMNAWRSRCRQTPRDPIHARFLETLHRILVADLGRWEPATAVLEEANRRAPWTRPSDQRAYQALAELHFNRIFFSEYELRRQAAARNREDGH